MVSIRIIGRILLTYDTTTTYKASSMERSGVYVYLSYVVEKKEGKIHPEDGGGEERNLPFQFRALSLILQGPWIENES